MSNSCDKPIFIFDCNDARTFFVSVSAHQDQLVESASVLTLSASDTIAPVLCASKTFKFNEVPKNLNDKVAYVTSSGNDSTGQIGDISFPYATMQAAYNAGATMFELGIGTFAGITALTGTIARLKVRGSGGVSMTPESRTVVTDLKKSGGSIGIRLEDVGYQSVFFTNIGESTLSASTSATSDAIQLFKVKGSNIYANGSQAENGGLIELDECEFGTIYTNGGSATGVLTAGKGGDVYLTDCVVGTIFTNGGSAISGNGGNSGYVNLDKSVTNVNANGGSSEYGAGGRSVNMDISNCYMPDSTIYHNSGYTNIDNASTGVVTIKNSTIGYLYSNGARALSMFISGTGGAVTVDNSTVEYIETIGGNGNVAGNGGTVTVYNSKIGAINASSGDYSSSSDGNGGSVTLDNSRVTTDIQVYGNVSVGVGGDITLHRSNVAGVYGSAPTVGNLNVKSSYIVNVYGFDITSNLSELVTTTGCTIGTATLSLIDGTTY